MVDLRKASVPLVHLHGTVFPRPREKLINAIEQFLRDVRKKTELDGYYLKSYFN